MCCGVAIRRFAFSSVAVTVPIPVPVPVQVGHFAPRVAPKRNNRKFTVLIAKPRENQHKLTKSIKPYEKKLRTNTKNSWRVRALVNPSTFKVFISLRTASDEDFLQRSCDMVFYGADLWPKTSVLMIRPMPFQILYTPYSMKSLFSEFFRKFGGVFLEACEIISWDIWELFEGNMKEAYHDKK